MISRVVIKKNDPITVTTGGGCTMVTGGGRNALWRRKNFKSMSRQGKATVLGANYSQEFQTHHFRCWYLKQILQFCSVLLAHRFQVHRA